MSSHTKPAARRRRSIRLAAHDYSGAGAYFITIVTAGRAACLGEIRNGEMRLSGWGQVAEDCLRAIPEHFTNAELDAYVVMPNHVHAIIVLHGAQEAGTASAGATQQVARASQWDAPTNTPRGPAPGSLGAIVGTYKMAVTRIAGQRVWQRNYHEHIIRDEQDWDRTRRYIECNVMHWKEDTENPGVAAAHSQPLGTI